MVLPEQCCTEARVHSLAVLTRLSRAVVVLLAGLRILVLLPSLREILQISIFSCVVSSGHGVSATIYMSDYRVASPKVSRTHKQKSKLIIVITKWRTNSLKFGVMEVLGGVLNR